MHLKAFVVVLIIVHRVATHVKSAATSVKLTELSGFVCKFDKQKRHTKNVVHVREKHRKMVIHRPHSYHFNALSHIRCCPSVQYSFGIASWQRYHVTLKILYYKMWKELIEYCANKVCKNM